MANCLVAQSGGPTAVINSSLAGVVRANQLNPLYDRVFGGLYGIEGTLDGKLYDLTDLTGRDIELLQQTPSSALGTCRYKLKRGNDTDYHRLVEVMDSHDITTMFYIGGNDSMDTVDALAATRRASASSASPRPWTTTSCPWTTAPAFRAPRRWPARSRTPRGWTTTRTRAPRCSCSR